MTLWLTDLADVLRGRGLDVVEIDGWETRSYPKWPGYEVMPNTVMVHHTASKATVANDLNYILTMSLAPICNLYLDRGGVFHVVAAGRSVTNGEGHDWWGGGTPDNMMNHHAISIEAANDGVGEPWPLVQTNAYVTGCAALCNGYSIPVDHVRAHWEWTTRKIDPAGHPVGRPAGESPWAAGKASWDMDAFRAAVSNQMEDDMTTARLVRFNGYVNVFLLGGGGPAQPVGDTDYAHLEALGVVKVFVDHHQELLSVCRQAGLDPANPDELVPGGPTDRF